MMLDPTNKTVKLCVEGIEQEMSGNVQRASALYQDAWNVGENDLEWCIAAHYMARVQNDPQLALSWNKKALQHADKTGEDNIRSFYPSLYLNVGKSYEDIGEYEQAGIYYNRGLALFDALPDNILGNMTREGIKRGIERIDKKRS
jgi:tetratricopeptide (TPR) repeat protein